MSNHRQLLFEFLDARVFNPTASADPLRYASTEERKLLKRVQKRVHDSRVRYVADYPSAAEIKSNFTQDLHSKAGQALASDLLILGLPRFEDVREDFMALCQKLGL